MRRLLLSDFSLLNKLALVLKLQTSNTRYYSATQRGLYRSYDYTLGTTQHSDVSYGPELRLTN